MYHASFASGTSTTWAASPSSLWQLVACMLRLGTLGFGRPVALVGSVAAAVIGLPAHPPVAHP
ncbi:hypothetical protein GCM10028796_03620 [Ramlibacter monticola]|uniref:Uncharacterized protein n=1 Tax=Ramlibacter monticola TaxID=1926872 RepID=A0A937CSL9_9BURK|nr:hypothetical protein [Ramlibacter monticola]MBL0391351.1 hypothetical protein [Ramlibacter monticola]